MKDLSCLLAGLLNLLSPPLMLIFWYRKTGARLFPAFAAYAVCFPVFFIANAVRSGFSHNDAITFYIQQGLLYGFFEESAKFLMMRFCLTSYDSRKDSVTYAIGHDAYEEFAIGLTCLFLIGSDRAAPDILLFQSMDILTCTASGVASAVLIFYGIRNDKSIVILPVVVLLHAVENASAGIFIESVAIAVRLICAAGKSCAAYRCWKSLKSPFEDIP